MASVPESSGHVLYPIPTPGRKDCFLPQGLEPGQEGNANSAVQGRLTWLLSRTEPGPGITYKLYKHACGGDPCAVQRLPSQGLQTVCFPRPLWPINIVDAAARASPAVSDPPTFPSPRSEVQPGTRASGLSDLGTLLGQRWGGVS